MRHQAIRAAALMLGVLFAGAGPARAASITLEDVVRAVGASGQVRPADEVRLRFASQSGRAAGPQNPSAQGTEPSAPQQQTDGPAAASTAAVTGGPTDATLSQTGGGQVETVDLGDVTGTVCDCGEIPPIIEEGGGFPWWLLGGVPLICVSGVCFDSSEECENPPCTPPPPPPSPTPPPNPIPEPATLLLFGSGLLAVGARARRRFGRKDSDTQPADAAEEV